MSETPHAEKEPQSVSGKGHARLRGMVKANLRCNLTGKPFSVWFRSEDEIPLACEQLGATLIDVTPSNETALVLAQFEALFCRAMFPRDGK